MNFSVLTSSRDDIAALSSGHGLAALAVIRLSGPRTREILKAVLEKAGCLKKPRQLLLDEVLDETGEPLDRVLSVFFAGPASYTGEDMAEIHCHGGRAVYGRILSRLFAAGCREALPGEFTRRAFESGKLDLTRAEAVMHIINARTPQQVKAAAQVLAGKFSDQLQKLRQRLLEALAFTEARLDFPEEEIEAPLGETLMELAQEARKWTERLFRVSPTAIEIAICGRQNAGKSSLLNRLAGRELALVTPLAGTTRDAVRFRSELAGREVEFLDTAGLAQEARDELDRLSQEKTVQNAHQASLILWMYEAGSFVPPPAWCKEPLLVANKIDLLDGAQREKHRIQAQSNGAVMISALSGEGLEKLLAKIEERLEQKFGPQDGLPASLGQAQAIENLASALRAAEERYREGALELTAEELRRGCAELGRLLGESLSADVLDMIFSRFCIGK